MLVFAILLQIAVFAVGAVLPTRLISVPVRSSEAPRSSSIENLPQLNGRNNLPGKPFSAAQTGSVAPDSRPADDVPASISRVVLPGNAISAPQNESVALNSSLAENISASPSSVKLPGNDISALHNGSVALGSSSADEILAPVSSVKLPASAVSASRDGPVPSDSSSVEKIAASIPRVQPAKSSISVSRNSSVAVNSSSAEKISVSKSGGKSVKSAIPVLYNSSVASNSSLARNSCSNLAKRTLSKAFMDKWCKIPVSTEEVRTMMVNKGKYYNLLIISDIDAAGKMMEDKLGPDPKGNKWQKPKSLVTMNSQWTTTDISRSEGVAESLKPLSKMISDQQVGILADADLRKGDKWMRIRSPNSEPYPDGPNVCLKFKQDKVYAGSTRKVDIPPTGGRFEFWLNIVDGIVIVRAAGGPLATARKSGRPDDYRSSNPMPRISHFSDVLYNAWTGPMRLFPGDSTQIPAGTRWDKYEASASSRSIASPGMVRFLNYIILQAIKGPPETLQIIQRCLVERNRFVPPAWPEFEEFEIGTDCFYALLATTNSYGIAWFLAQHKVDYKLSAHGGGDGLGHKMLASVRITAGDSTGLEDTNKEEWAALPTLIWKVVEFDQALVPKEGQRQSAQQDPGPKAVGSVGVEAGPAIADDSMSDADTDSNSEFEGDPMEQ